MVRTLNPSLHRVHEGDRQTNSTLIARLVWVRCPWALVVSEFADALLVEHPWHLTQDRRSGGDRDGCTEDGLHSFARGATRPVSADQGPRSWDQLYGTFDGRA